MRVTAQTVRFGKAILGRLLSSPEPVRRADLADLALDIWPDAKPATRERRFRESRSWLVRQGYALLSDGKGFRIARTAEEFDQAIRHMERAAKEILVEISYLRRKRPPAGGEAVQLELRG
jgi:hypothetical protein